MRLAARGTRNLDGGEEPILDEGLRRALRQRARKVYAESTLLAVLMTAASMIAP